MPNAIVASLTPSGTGRCLVEDLPGEARDDVLAVLHELLPFALARTLLDRRLPMVVRALQHSGLPPLLAYGVLYGRSCCSSRYLVLGRNIVLGAHC